MSPRTMLIVGALFATWPYLAEGYEPTTVPFTTPAESLRLVNKAVRLTLLERGWRVDKELDTSVQATLERADERLRVTILITFDTSKATIAYVDSNVVSYSNGMPGSAFAEARPTTVNARKYEAWVDNLAKDMPIYLERIRILLN